MILRSLQPRIIRHVVGVPFINFGSLVLALYDVEDCISRGLWSYSSSVDAKGKKPIGRQRSYVGTITSTSQRLLGHHQPVSQPVGTYPSYSPRQYRSRAPPQLYDQTYPSPTLVQPHYAVPGKEKPPVSYLALIQPCYATQGIEKPPTLYPRPRVPQAFAHFALRTLRQFSQLGMLLS